MNILTHPPCFRVEDVDTDTGTKQKTVWCPCQGDIPKLLGFPWVAVTIKEAGLDTICEYSRFLGPLMARLWELTLLQRLPMNERFSTSWFQSWMLTWIVWVCIFPKAQVWWHVAAVAMKCPATMPLCHYVHPNRLWKWKAIKLYTTCPLAGRKKTEQCMRYVSPNIPAVTCPTLEFFPAMETLRRGSKRWTVLSCAGLGERFSTTFTVFLVSLVLNTTKSLSQRDFQ